MHKELLKFLACPICRTSITFDGKTADNRFVNGYLKCVRGHLYQVKEEMGLIKDAKLSAGEFEWRVDVADESKYNEIQKQYNSYLNEDLRTALKKLMDILINSVIKSCLDTNNIVLDIASGMGRFVLQLAEKIPKDTIIIGTDVDEKPLRGAMNKAKKIGVYQKISLIVTDAKHLAFKDKALSTVSSHFGFDNVPETVLALKESFRVLKPDGKVIFSSVWLKEGSESIKIAEKYKVGQIASENRLKQTLKKTGFILDWFEEVYSGVWPYNPMDLLPVQGEEFSHVIVQIRKPKNA
ncbi:class I SAM-dependent methyltransferase [Candidatus Bathyarchaeota archaeon]|nr:class I SAM-dependent methyltransferase [Candidatus Bathyarchaeota archaeon]